MDAARRGDSTAFETLNAPHRRALHGHCYRMLGSYTDAEDAMQKALLLAWRGLGEPQLARETEPCRRVHAGTVGSPATGQSSAAVDRSAHRSGGGWAACTA